MIAVCFHATGMGMEPASSVLFGGTNTRFGPTLTNYHPGNSMKMVG